MWVRFGLCGYLFVEIFVCGDICLWRYVVVNVHFVYRIILSEICGIGKWEIVGWGVKFACW